MLRSLSTLYSAAPVPVLLFLAEVLTEHRKRSDGNGYVFGVTKPPIDLHKLTTLAFYVKTARADAHAAMARLERELGNEWVTAKGTQIN